MLSDWSFQKTAFLFAAMGIIAILSFRKSSYGLFFLLAIIFLRPQDDRPIMAALHIPMVISIIATLSAIKSAKLSVNALMKQPVFKLFLMFLAIVNISAITAINQEVAWLGVSNYKSIFILFILILTLLETKEDFNNFNYVLLICGLYFAYLLQFRGNYMMESIGNMDFGRKNFMRLNINFGNPNYLAITSVIMFNIAFSFFLRHKKILLKIAYGSCCLIYIYTIIQTQSRGGTISLVLSLILFSIMSKNGRKIGVTLILLASLSIAILPQYFPEYFHRLETISNYEEDHSATNRLQLWQMGLNFIADNPFIGIGPDNFQELAFNSPHNSYIQMASELGIPGFLIWLTLFYEGWQENRKARKIYEKHISSGLDMYYNTLAIEISLLACALQSVVTGLGHREFLFMLIAQGGVTHLTAQKLNRELQEKKTGEYTLAITSRDKS